MRILLDEDLPRRLAAMLVGHEVSTVQRSGWTGIKNGKLLGLAAGEFDVFRTMDRNLEFQQNLATLPIAVLVVEAVSNRMEHLVPLVPGILKELNHIPPKSLRKIGAYPSTNTDPLQAGFARSCRAGYRERWASWCTPQCAGVSCRLCS